MDYVYVSMFGAIAGISSMILVYAYLYTLYRERYMGIWIISWLGFCLRIILFDSGMFDWKQSLLGFIVFQIMYIYTNLLFLWSTQLFIGRPVNRWWLYCATGIFILNIVFEVLHFPFIYKLFFSAWFAGLILIYIGRTFILNLQIKGASNRITGYAFILGGIFTLSTPYTLSLNISWLTSLNYNVGGILHLMIATGVLLVYLEKNRTAFINKETQYRLFAENAVDVIYRFRIVPEVKFEYVSPSVFAVTGYTSADFYADAKLFEKIIHPEDLQLFKKFTSNPSWCIDLPLEYRLIHKDKSTVYIEQKYHPVYDKIDKLVAREGVLRDVTARNNIEQVSSQFDRMNMVGQMAIRVANEIRNPLTTIRGYLQFSEKEKGIDKEYLHLMMKELDSISTIINEYLLLAKDKRVDLKKCCLNSIVKASLPLMQVYAATSNVLIKFDLGDVPEMCLDESEIRHLLLNLVRNGVEAMPTGGELAIGTGLEQDKVVLSVKDQGSGISARVLDNLGMPFLTTKDGGNIGTGLGLPTCYRIATRHNASIDVKTGGNGTIVFVCFYPYLVA